MTDKLIGKIHIGIIQDDENGEVKFDWGYNIDYTVHYPKILPSAFPLSILMLKGGEL